MEFAQFMFALLSILKHDLIQKWNNIKSEKYQFSSVKNLGKHIRKKILSKCYKSDLECMRNSWKRQASASGKAALKLAAWIAQRVVTELYLYRGIKLQQFFKDNLQHYEFLWRMNRLYRLILVVVSHPYVQKSSFVNLCIVNFFPSLSGLFYTI